MRRESSGWRWDGVTERERSGRGWRGVEVGGGLEVEGGEGEGHPNSECEGPPCQGRTPLLDRLPDGRQVRRPRLDFHDASLRGKAASI